MEGRTGGVRKRKQQEKAGRAKRNKSKLPWKLGEEAGSRRERPGTESFREDDDGQKGARDF